MRLRRRAGPWETLSLGPPPALSIGGYAVHLDQRLGRIGGLAAYAAMDQRGGSDLLALVAPSPRLRVLKALRDQWMPGLMTPLADGPSEAGHLIICRRPSGDCIEAGGAWTEDDLLYRVLRPVARALAQLHQLDVAHGAIHPANLFGGGPTDAVSLGGGWANPPGSTLSAAYRPLGWTRASRDAADDIFALGVTLLALLSGNKPRPDLDEASLLRERQTHGTADTLLHQVAVSAPLDRLLRSMLADEAWARPKAAALADPCLLLDLPWAPVGFSDVCEGTPDHQGWRGALALGRVSPSFRLVG